MHILQIALNSLLEEDDKVQVEVTVTIKKSFMHNMHSTSC